MTPIFCCTCGADLGGREMSALFLAHNQGHIQDMHTVSALYALSRFIEDAYPTDEATPRLTAVIATKVARLVGAN